MTDELPRAWRELEEMTPPRPWRLATRLAIIFILNGVLWALFLSGLYVAAAYLRGV